MASSLEPKNKTEGGIRMAYYAISLIQTCALEFSSMSSQYPGKAQGGRTEVCCLKELACVSLQLTAIEMSQSQMLWLNDFIGSALTSLDKLLPATSVREIMIGYRGSDEAAIYADGADNIVRLINLNAADRAKIKNFFQHSQAIRLELLMEALTLPIAQIESRLYGDARKAA